MSNLLQNRENLCGFYFEKHGNQKDKIIKAITNAGPDQFTYRRPVEAADAAIRQTG